MLTITHHATSEGFEKVIKNLQKAFDNEQNNQHTVKMVLNKDSKSLISYNGEPVRYVYTVIGGGWSYTSQAYFITDNKVYHVSKFTPDMFEMELKDIPFTGVVDIDTTNLDFEKHGDEMLMDVAHITMYRYENGKYKKLWMAGYLDENSAAVYEIKHAFDMITHQ